MASPSPYSKRRSSPPSPPRSKPTGGSGFFGKSVVLALFLLALPLFPSQAPDFVGETVFTKFWELIHLLFIGIAVAYGLFSRRNVESGLDFRTSGRENESSLSYVSRIFQVSSVFDDDDEELDNSCQFIESGRDSEVVKERKSESFVVESELEEELCEYGKISEVRAWNSKYFQERSKVVVARPAYGLDGHVVHQPLGLPVRSLRSALEDNNNSTSDGGPVNESLADEIFDEVMAAPISPGRWQSRPEMMGIGDNYPSNFQSLPVDETQFASINSRSSRSTVSSASSSSSSRTSFESHTQNRFSPSRSVSEESLDSNVEEELVKEKSLQGSSRSSSPSLPPSPSLSPSPPSPELVTDDTHRRVSHSRHYSDGSLLEEDVRRGFGNEFDGSKVRDRRAELFGKKERGSKSLNLTGESSRRGGSKSRRSYPPESISSPVRNADDTAARRRDIQQKSNGYLFEDSIGKGLELDLNNPRVKKGRSHDSLELTAEGNAKDEKFSESFPHLDVLFKPTNAKASRHAMRSSRGGRDTLPEREVTRNSEEDNMDLDKSRKKDLLGELKSNSPRCEPQSWRFSSKVPLRGKSVRTIRSDRHKTDGESSDDRGVVAKVESRGRTKSRRQRQEEELSIVLHQEKTSETRAESEPEDDETIEETVAEQPQVNLVDEEEEEAAWESQSNASHDHNEVDRKAGEFIAKFREQIRLQKLTSGEQPRGRGGGGEGHGINIRNSHFR